MLAAHTFGPYDSVASPMSVFSVQVFDNDVSGNAWLGTAFATPQTFANRGGVVIGALAISLS
jgi:hypothetical protein